MDRAQLLAFERIAREGSFSRAALAIGIGQPAISARIHALEAAVGGALFTRGRRVALTPMGESFLPAARRALQVIDEGLETARLAQSGRRGRVRLGVLGSLAGGLVGAALAEFVAARPDVECWVRSGNHEDMVEMLVDGLVEVAILTWPAPEGRAASLAPLLVLREPVVLVAHPRHPLAARATVSKEELVRKARPLLWLRWWPTHHPELARLARASGTAVDVTMEAARRMVLDRVGAGFFTRTYIADDLARGTLKELRVRKLAPVHRDSALVRLRRTVPLSPAALRLVELIHARAERLGLSPSRPGPRPRPGPRARRG
jgi:DNA-binding transcriptional LysR family regulator